MKKTLAVILVLILVLVIATGCGGGGSIEESEGPIDIIVGEAPSENGDNGSNDVIYEGPLVGTWSGVESGFHGNSGYYWSFGKDGRFAYLFSGYEPPQGGGDIKSSVRERFMQGKFHENSSTIECYGIRVDDFFARGDNSLIEILPF